MSAPERRCVSCKEVRSREDFASSQARRCNQCKDAGGPPRPCSRCKEVRTADQFVWRGHVCADCRAEEKPPRACLRCHEVKPASAFPVGAHSKEGQRRERNRGQKSTRLSAVCQACWDAEAEAKAARKRKEWKQDGRLVRQCTKCSEVKDYPQEFYGSRRRPDGSVVYDTQCKSCAKIRGEASRKARASDPNRRKEHLAKRAALERARRAKNRERIREINRRHREKMKADPARHAVHLEVTRMNYRLRQERKGRELAKVKASPTAVMARETVGGYLPAGPLLRELTLWLARQDKPADVALPSIGVDDRTWRRWKSGEATQVRESVAHAALVGLGLSWRDVWVEPEHRATAERIFEAPSRELRRLPRPKREQERQAA